VSVQAITWALDYAAGNVTEKVLLLVLANYANEFGVSWPSQKTLVDQTALGERTVRRVLADMERRGVIRRIVRRRGNGSRQSDMILVAAFEGRKPAPPGMLDDGPDGTEMGAPDQSANGDNRPMLPLDNRPPDPDPSRPKWPPLILQRYQKEPLLRVTCPRGPRLIPKSTRARLPQVMPKLLVFRPEAQRLGQDCRQQAGEVVARLLGADGRFDRGFGKALGERVDLRGGKGFGFRGRLPSGVGDVGGMAEGCDGVDHRAAVADRRAESLRLWQGRELLTGAGGGRAAASGDKVHGVLQAEFFVCCQGLHSGLRCVAMAADSR